MEKSRVRYVRQPIIKNKIFFVLAEYVVLSIIPEEKNYLVVFPVVWR